MSVRPKSFLAFLHRFCLFFRSFLLFFNRRIKLDSHGHDAVVSRTVLVNPFFWFEITLDGKHGTFGQHVEGIGVLVLTPCLDIHKAGNAVGFLSVFLQSAYCQRETCYAGIGELMDFCVLCCGDNYVGKILIKPVL